MSAVCLIIAGAVVATLPTQQFTVGWTHSVAKTRWEEIYRIDDDRLLLIEARVQGMGAGMEPADGARLVNGWWTWRPTVPPLPALQLSLSPYTSDYDVCFATRCAKLGALAGRPETADAEVVTVKACRDPG